MFELLSFADPWFLLLLAPLLLLAFWPRRRVRAVDGGSERLLGDLPATWRTRTAWVPKWLMVLAAALLIVALARPLEGRVETRMTKEGIDMVVVVDVSSSMLDHGLERTSTNLEVVKEVVADFMRVRENDRIGLVTFAVLPRSESPLTLDKNALLSELADVECVRPNSVEDGTAIGAALAHAANKLRESPSKSRVVVLLTDGEENNAEIPSSEAIAYCKQFGVKVYTVGAGRFFDPTSRAWFQRSVDSSLLEKIAGETGGRFFVATDTDSLKEVYSAIDELETVEIEDFRYTDFEDVHASLLVAAALLLALGLLAVRGPYLEVVS